MRAAAAPRWVRVKGRVQRADAVLRRRYDVTAVWTAIAVRAAAVPIPVARAAIARAVVATARAIGAGATRAICRAVAGAVRACSAAAPAVAAAAAPVAWARGVWARGASARGVGACTRAAAVAWARTVGACGTPAAESAASRHAAISSATVGGASKIRNCKIHRSNCRGQATKGSPNAAARSAERAAAHPPGTAGRLRRSNIEISECLQIRCRRQPAGDNAGGDLRCRKASGGREPRRGRAGCRQSG